MGCLRAAAALWLAAAWWPATAAQLSAEVRDAGGRALADVVVWLEPADGHAPRTKPALVEIRQTGSEFVPLVTVVAVGTRIEFPNLDTVKHHIYSFSPAKNFEVQLYSGKPEAPVLFDKPGLVVLGCNIHDWMLAYVQVVPTDSFGKSGPSGAVRLPDVAAGRYALRAWHPYQKADLPPQLLDLGEAEARSVKLSIDINPPPPQKPRPKQEGY
jgi:plastocyanin